MNRFYLILPLVFCGLACDLKFDATQSSYYKTELRELGPLEVAKMQPAWSPDGSKIVYVARRTATQLESIDFETNRLTRIAKLEFNAHTNSTTYAISPDASKLMYYDRSERNTYVTDLAGGQKILLVEGGVSRPAWSRDGNWIAYRGKNRIWRIPSSGGTPEEIPEPPNRSWWPTWSPDGSKIAFTSKPPDGHDQIWVADLNTGTSTPVTPDSVRSIWPAWSPTDNTIAYTYITTNGDSTIVLALDLTTLQTKRISSDSTSRAGSPSWSPDGERIAYQADFGYVWIASKEGQLLRRTQYRQYYPAKWHPLGTSFLRLRNVNASTIEVLSLETGEVQQLTSFQNSESDREPAWFPDGENIAFVRQDTSVGSGRTFIVPLAGGSATPLLPDAEYDAVWAREANPAISLDGQYLLQEYLNGIQLVPLDSRIPQSVGEFLGAGIRSPAWGPDSRSAVFSFYNGLIVFAVDSTLDIDKVDIRIENENRLLSPAWSVDYPGHGSYIAAVGDSGLYVMKPDGSEPILIVKGDIQSPTWSPLVREIAFTRNNNLFVLPIFPEPLGEQK